MADSWRTVMDRLEGDSEKLLEMRVPGKDAQVAAEKAMQTNRRIWRFVNSVEALYVERVYDLAAILKQAQDVTNLPTGELLAALAEGRGITIHGKAVAKWARAHGVDPDVFKTETWRDDIEGTK